MAILATQGLRKHFGPVPALRGIDLEVKEGEFLALLGPNGAGKSTLLDCLSLTCRPTEGHVLWRGKDAAADSSAYRRSLGVISHQLFLYPDLTGLENLRFFAKLYGVNCGEGPLEETLAEQGLLEAARRPVRTYSRGMRQRLAIARALIHDPELILLDEPFTGLDVAAADRLSTQLKALRGRGRTVLLVTHQAAQARMLADRATILVGGRLRVQLPLTDLTEGALESAFQSAMEQFGGER